MALVVPYMVRRIRQPDDARLLSMRKIMSIGLIITAMGAISIALGGNPIDEYANRLRPEYIMRGLGSRIGTNLIAFNHFMENPLLGKGFGFDTNLTTLVSQVGLDAGKDYFEVSLSEVHSLYFYALMHTGLLGFGAGLYLFYRAARDTLRVRITTPLYRHTHQWVAGGAGIFLTILLLGILSIKSFSLEAWMVFGVSLGILFRVRRIVPIARGVYQQ
jgi:O-antigen ligase